MVSITRKQAGGTNPAGLLDIVVFGVGPGVTTENALVSFDTCTWLSTASPCLNDENPGIRMVVILFIHNGKECLNHLTLDHLGGVH